MRIWERFGIKIKSFLLKGFYRYKHSNVEILPDYSFASSFLEKYRRNMDDSVKLVHNKLLEQEYNLNIIIPTYNNEHYIQCCLDSIVSQKTKYKIKITVVNDGSTDGTGE